MLLQASNLWFFFLNLSPLSSWDDRETCTSPCLVKSFILWSDAILFPHWQPGLNFQLSLTIWFSWNRPDTMIVPTDTADLHLRLGAWLRLFLSMSCGWGVPRSLMVLITTVFTAQLSSSTDSSGYRFSPPAPNFRYQSGHKVLLTSQVL